VVTPEQLAAKLNEIGPPDLRGVFPNDLPDLGPHIEWGPWKVSACEPDILIMGGDLSLQVYARLLRDSLGRFAPTRWVVTSLPMVSHVACNACVLQETKIGPAEVARYHYHDIAEKFVQCIRESQVRFQGWDGEWLKLLRITRVRSTGKKRWLVVSRKSLAIEGDGGTPYRTRVPRGDIFW